MAKTTLRAYNREIENLIEQGHFNQAIAHCRHILSVYNKHINSYRLLGKAFLESQRYGDAADIFQRVLSTVPDDFISQVGMSIIREDEGNLVEAIWHMERAYEVQPANSAIQRELQRLYGQRDGIEPPKIRLTHGALARMYLRGELYQQAINEIRPAQAQVQQRPDLLVILANAYFLDGQRVEAAQICSRLIKRLPYCYEANRILAEILADSERSEETEAYLQRIIALEPYAAHTSSSALNPDDVPDSAITLDKLDWTSDISPTELSAQPEWATSLGVEIDGKTTEEAALPDWLSSMQDEATDIEDTDQVVSDDSSLQADSLETGETQAALLSEPSLDDTIPEWMKDAGWKPASGAKEGPSETTDIKKEEELSRGELSPAELPDWVKAMAPSDTAETEDQSQSRIPDASQDDSFPIGTGSLPWLEETTDEQADTVASWLEEKKPQVPPTGRLDLDSGESVEIPDWLQELGKEKAISVPEDTIPDHEDKEIHDEVEIETGSEDVSDLPEWAAREEVAIGAAVVGAIATASKDKESVGDVDETIPESDRVSPERSEDASDLESFTEAEIFEKIVTEPELEETLEPLPEHSPEVVSEQETPIYDWIPEREVYPESQAEGIIEPSSEITPSEDLSEPPREIDVEEPISHPEFAQRPESMDIEAELLQKFDEELEETTEGELPTLEDEDAYAWLEGLAAKQGVDEALLLSSEERQDTPPDWVVETTDEGGELADEIQPFQSEIREVIEKEKTSEVKEQIADKTTLELPDWLEAEEPGEPVDETPVEPDITEIPKWLKKTAPLSDQVEGIDESKPQDGIPDWLKVSVTGVGIAVTAPSEDEKIISEPPEAVEQIEADQIEDIPEWLSEMEVEEPITVATKDVETADLPELTEDIQTEPEIEMLFGPKILVQKGQKIDLTESQKVHTIDEGPIKEEDTKPTRITPEEQVSTQTVGIESPDVEPPEIDVAPVDEMTVETEGEELPDWSQDLSKEIEIPADEPTPIEPEKVLPETISFSEEEIVESPEKMPETLVTASVDDDEAFAWLEGLAAKHGAEEAMLLEPEEHKESPPDWVQALTKLEDTSIQPDVTEVITSEPELTVKDATTGLEEDAEKDENDIEGPVEDTIVATEFQEEKMIPEIIPEEVSVVQEEVEATTIKYELAEPEVESILEEGVSEPIAEKEAGRVDTIHELPPWLAGVDQESDMADEQEWTPPSDLTEEERIEEPPFEKEIVRLNINEAGLVELERLPGVGFIKAQAIIEYRESNGPFTSIEDLQSVSGIGPSLLMEIEEMIIIEVPGEAESIELPTDENQVTMIQARNALIKGEIAQSLEQYQVLIETQHMLSDVIQDLNEALYRFPVDVDIWQTLGDAHMRKGQIQEALDAYTKAEELL